MSTLRRLDGEWAALRDDVTTHNVSRTNDIFLITFRPGTEKPEKVSRGLQRILLQQQARTVIARQ